MGWFDCHLWEFTIGERRYGLPPDQDWGTEPRFEAAKARLRDVVNSGSTTIHYFGDSWEHCLTVTAIRQGDPDSSYPRYVGGERNAPPEDCGGIPGFTEIRPIQTIPIIPKWRTGLTTMIRTLSTNGPSRMPSLASPISETRPRCASSRIAGRRHRAEQSPESAIFTGRILPSPPP